MSRPVQERAAPAAYRRGLGTGGTGGRVAIVMASLTPCCSVAAGAGYGGAASPSPSGVVDVRAQGLLHPTGSRGVAVGADVSSSSTADCGSPGGLRWAGVGGWSLSPLPDEDRVGADLLGMVGVGGAWRSSDCHHGAFAGGRLGVPIRLFASRPPWELDRDGAPTFYLVPQLDAVRYLNPGGLDAEPSWQLSAGLVLRVFVWTRLEP